MTSSGGIVGAGALTLVALTSCTLAEPDGRDPAVVTTVIDTFDTLVTTESGLLGSVSGIAVARDGTVWLSDRVMHHLVALPPDGSAARPIGREGQGPGELIQPEALVLADDRILVFDYGNRRLQWFAADGEQLESEPLTRSVLLPVDLNGQGSLAAPTMGRNRSLATLLRRGAGDGMAVGEPPVPPPAIMDLSAIREQASRGEVPTEFRNLVLPVLGPDGALSLVHQASGLVEHYSAAGELAWTRQLSDPVLLEAHAAYIEEAAEPFDPRDVPIPRSVVAATAAGIDVLWLLLPRGAAGEAPLLEMDRRTGEPLRRFLLRVVSSPGPFAIDAEDGWLYLSIPDDGTLVRARLPD